MVTSARLRLVGFIGALRVLGACGTGLPTATEGRHDSAPQGVGVSLDGTADGSTPATIPQRDAEAERQGQGAPDASQADAGVTRASADGASQERVIPVKDIIGGVGPANNAKTNPSGGYRSNLDNISEFKYPATHGNQWGNTAIVNDHTYWDSPEGIKATHVPAPDPGGGSALIWPEPGEWFSYAINVTTAGTYNVMTRFSSGWGPASPVVVHMTVDDVSGGPFTLKPDDQKIWADKYYQVGGWWGHTMTNCTSPTGWALSPGRHVLKVFVDSFPKPTTGSAPRHGNLWIHYFKIVPG